MADIRIIQITKRFGEKTVLDHFSADFPAGTTTCIMGASGSGKTTLLHLLAGLLQADGGEIYGVPEKIGMIFQEDRLCPELSAMENIRLVTGKTKSEAELRAHLAELGLAEHADRPICELSGGMKRRVAIARAVCYAPELLLMDEPFKGLDAALRIQTVDYIRRHCPNVTVLCVTHDAAEAELLGGRILRMTAERSISYASGSKGQF